MQKDVSKKFDVAFYEYNVFLKVLRSKHTLTTPRVQRDEVCSLVHSISISFNFYHSSRWEKKDLPSLEITILAPRLSDGRVPTFGSTVSTEVIGELSIKAL